MLLQNTLDLSTFEIVRFRIWNQTSNPNDYGIGTKYFNTNSGHEGYNRENIYTATGWRRAAYLDDIDKINEKLDLIFGDELDTDTIIDSWKEVQDFLAGIEDTKNLMTMLDGKLDKTGGIMAENAAITWGAEGGPFIRGNGAGGLFLSSSVLQYRTLDGNNFYDIIHSGNALDMLKGTFLPLTGGTIRGNLIMAEGHVVTRELYASADNTYNLGNISRRWANIHTMLINGGTPIHSGNVGEHTAGAANKLADDTAYTVWGRTFFENGKPKNVSNAPILNNNSGLYFKNAAGDANKLLFYFDTAEQLHIGRDSATDKNATHIYGNPTYFKSSNTGQPLVTITEEGNVLVGVNNADDYTFAAKNALFAIGLQSTNPTTPKELDAENLFSLVNTSSSRYGLHAWILNGGSANIQSARADGVNDNTYALNLNPLGGAVNIGSTNSYTNVIGPLQVATQIYVGNSSSSYIMMQREGYNYIWANKENSSIMLGIGETSNKATLAIYKGSIEAGTTNAVSLGSSSYRWSNVYSVGGDFSGRVLVGKALDDENYKLITNGAVKIGRSGDAGTYLGITVSDVLTTFDANDNSDKYMRYSFRSHGTELLLLDGKEGGTSYFRTLVRFYKEATFNGGALIPTGQKMTFGADGPTMEYDADANAIKVTGNIYATGTMASGGKAAEGEGDTGGGGNANVYSDVLEGVTTQEWEVGNPFQKEDVIVSLYMWNTDESRWEMVLADIGVTSENIWVTFGRPTSTTDKYMAVVMG